MTVICHTFDIENVSLAFFLDHVQNFLEVMREHLDLGEEMLSLAKYHVSHLISEMSVRTTINLMLKNYWGHLIQAIEVLICHVDRLQF